MTSNIGKELCFSKPAHDNATTAEAFGVSVIFHSLLVLAAVWLTIAPPVREIAEDQHLLIPVLEEDKSLTELPPPPPPPPASKELQQTMTEAPRGFQTLTVPTYISPEIPPPTAGPEIDEADFTGEGVEGGRGRGVDPDPNRVVTTEDVSAAPAFTPYTVAPTLRNREEIAALLQKSYPVLLRDAGVGGTVIMWIYVDDTGQVRNTRVKQSSQIEPLDSAASKVSRQMRFRPAQNRDTRVPVWVSIPIHFDVER
jgi:TonB family protein